jgi:MoaA/NifB/PqqE/SkfB family radical SAM enzyme/GT2 family glycosyltransferase
MMDDIFEIAKLVVAYGFKPSIETNARVFAYEPLAKELKNFMIKSYYVEFFSNKPEIHNAITGEKESFTETVQGIMNLLVNKEDVIIKLILHRLSFKDIETAVEFLSGLGVARIQVVFPESAPEQYSELEEQVPKIEEAFPFINKALAKIDKARMDFLPGLTPFSMVQYQSKRIKKGRKTGEIIGHKLLFDNQLNISNKPIITIVIPTFNRSIILKNTLSSLFSQTLPPEQFEVIVIDDGSTDKTEEMIKSLEPEFRLRYILQDDLGYGPGRARNLGTIYAEGEIILFLDSDVICDPKNLEEHLKSHIHYKEKFNHDVLVIGKRLDMHTNMAIQKIINPKTILENFDAIKRIPARPDIREDFFHWCKDEPSNFRAPYVMIFTNNISIKRRYLLEAGLIDESFAFWSVEDQELGYRLQWLRFILNPDAKGYHQHHALVYSSKEGMVKAIKYNARIFYKKFLDPKIYDMYKLFISHQGEYMQINDKTINQSPFFRLIGKKPGSEKTYEQIQEEILFAKGESNTEIIFEGGNPLLHPNINEILRFTKKHGFKKITIDTEAESLKEIKTLLDLMRYGANRFIINLCGAKPEEHNYLANKKDSFEDTIRAIQNLAMLNQDFSVRIIISKQNFIHLKDMIEMLDALNVKKVTFYLPLDFEQNNLLFDETNLPISTILHYHIFEALKYAKELDMEINTDNIFSEFLGLNMSIITRMYELFDKPISVSRFGLR